MKPTGIVTSIGTAPAPPPEERPRRRQANLDLSQQKKAIPASATRRLKQDYLRLANDPVPYILAQPKPENILEWHYVVRAPEDSLYSGGFYHGKLVFPPDYPFKPPSIYMLTPNGRFKTNTRLCLSISDFHPDTWNPAWSVGTILTGLLSFMLETTNTYGSISTSDTTKRHLAYQSIEYNLANPTFRELFSELEEEFRDILKERNLAGETPVLESSAQQVSAPDQPGIFNHAVLLFALGAIVYLVNTVISGS